MQNKHIDYFNLDDLLTEEHKLIRESIFEWTNKSVKPIIDKASQEHRFPIHLMKELGELGAFRPFIPEQYGGSGLDHIAYGIIMQELQR
ncbi:acyl-CoA dehydrogenase family protein [Bacteroidota bacterium]